MFELLVTISIIGILMAVAMVSYSSAQRKARDNRRTQDINAIQKAAEQYFAANNYSYPASEAMPWTDSDGTTKILEQWPKDPKNSGSYIYPSFSSAGTTYCYCAKLEQTTLGNYGDVNCGAGTGYYCVRNQQ